MKKHLPKLLAIIALYTLTMCSKPVNEDPPSLTLTPTSKAVEANAGTFKVAILSTVPWMASSNEDWIDIDPMVGDGNSTMNVTHQPNISIAPRSATITIQGTNVEAKTVTLTQAGASPLLSVTPANQNVSSLAGNTTFDIQSNTSWTAQSDKAWCTLANSAGTGNAALSVNYDLNQTGIQRTAEITISSNGLEPKKVIITQKNVLTNVALANNGSIATAISSGYYSGITHHPAFAIDGDNISYWASQWDMPAWIKIQFNQTYTISKVGIWMASHKETFALSLSEDGIIWTLVVPHRLSICEEGSSIPIHETFEITPMKAKFIKCEITTTTAPSSHIFQAILNELEAFN
jgi:hypothetical protein